MNDQDPKHFEWWYNAVARVQAGYGNRDLGPVHDGFPECGFYRLKRKGQIAAAVAIYYDQGKLVGRETHAGDDEPRPLDKEGIEAIWTWVAKDPIPHELYRAFIETGRWPDMDEAVAAQVEAPGIGHNEPPDELEAIKDQIESAKASIASYEKIGDDETLAKAQSLRSRLLELSREADKKREALKRPHFEAGKAVDASWQPLVKDAKAAADTVRARMDVYETAKFKREQEERRKAEEARAAAEKAAREAEAAGAPPTAPEPEPQPAPAPAQASTIKGGYGRAATAKTVTVITEVTDWPALVAAFNDHPQVKDLVLTLAQRAVRDGADVPGVKTDQERKVA
jgi:hypothetical protein